MRFYSLASRSPLGSSSRDIGISGGDMKASEVIARLQELMKTQGDIECVHMDTDGLAIVDKIVYYDECYISPEYIKAFWIMGHI